MLPSQRCKNRVLSCAQSAGRQQSVIELGDVPSRLAHGEAITYWGWSRIDAHAKCPSVAKSVYTLIKGVYARTGSKCQGRAIQSDGLHGSNVTHDPGNAANKGRSAEVGIQRP